MEKPCGGGGSAPAMVGHLTEKMAILPGHKANSIKNTRLGNGCRYRGGGNVANATGEDSCLLDTRLRCLCSLESSLLDHFFRAFVDHN